jgi:hypothetical protein
MQESPIFSKTYDFLLWLMPATTKFPREQRFILAKFLQETALRFQECLIEAGVAGRGRTRTNALVRADVELTKLRFYLRLSRDMKLMKLNQYRHAAEMVAEIGRLLGGWRKLVGQSG